MNLIETDSSYLKYLPAIYQQEEIEGKANFLREFLKIFEKILSDREDPLPDTFPPEDIESLQSIEGIEEILDNVHDYFDLLYAPDEFITWLTGWIALAINEDWNDTKKRRLRSDAVSLYKIRGTLKAVERYLKIYTQEIGHVHVSEVIDLQIGDNEGHIVRTQIGINTRIGSTSPYFFEVIISLPEPDPFVLDFRRREVLNIIDLEKPAYTYYGLQLQVGTMQIGTDNLYGVHFHDVNIGWIVGAGGMILHTSDGGMSWIAQDSTVNDTLYDVFFHDSFIGWSVGAGGIILYTNDGGDNWKTQQSGVKTSLYAMDFYNEHSGWLVGKEGKILHTINGGIEWTHQTSGVAKSLLAVSFPTALRGWAVGEEGTILRTTNGGTGWNVQNSGTNETLRAVYFHNSFRGWLVGDNGIIRATTNGGNVWNIQTSGTNQNLYDVYFRNQQTGWVVGANGVILFTIDGGLTWQTLNSGVISDLLDVYFENSNIGWAAGEGGVILNTTDGGTNWSVSQNPKRVGHSTIGKDTLLGTFM